MRRTFPLNGDEKIVLKKQRNNRFKQSRLMYVYFVYMDGILIYIGSTKNPLVRMAHHRAMITRVSGYSTKSSFEVYGPFEYSRALYLEKLQIKNNFLSSKLLNQNGAGKRKTNAEEAGPEGKETARQGCIKTSLFNRQRLVFHN